IALFAAFVSAAVFAGLHGAKLLQIGPLVFDAGLVTFAVTFLCTDIVSEVYGKTYAKRLIIGGFIALVVGMILTQVALVLPAATEWEIAAEYNTIFSTGIRISLAMLATYITSQLTDIAVFAWIRKKTGSKYLWLRNNGSTMVAGLVDAIVFTTIAFYGVYDILPIILSAYTARIIISVIDTPFVYLGRNILYRLYPELESGRE
ncbi:MAG: queuosine precursor transporter, partial [Minisyncoccia bacterium]